MSPSAVYSQIIFTENSDNMISFAIFCESSQKISPCVPHSFGKQEEYQVKPTPVLHNLGTVTSCVSRCVESEEVVEWCKRQIS